MVGFAIKVDKVPGNESPSFVDQIPGDDEEFFRASMIRRGNARTGVQLKPSHVVALLGLDAPEAWPWILPFCFGLVPGSGFADGLRELGLTRLNLVTPLVGFNLGVELGQLAAVVLVLPVLWKLGRTLAYRRWGLSGLSWAIASIASVWVVDRAFGFQWLGG